MKHRHTFIIDAGNQPPPESLEIVPGENGQPSVLKIRHLSAAREWKITINRNELSAEVDTLRVMIDA